MSRVLGDGQRAIGKAAERRLKVTRHGIVHAGLDAATAEIGLDAIAPATRTTNR